MGSSENRRVVKKKRMNKMIVKEKLWFCGKFIVDLLRNKKWYEVNKSCDYRNILP